MALHKGQIGALRWICWWQERQDFIGGGCCLERNKCQNNILWNNSKIYQLVYTHVYLKAGGGTPGWADKDLGVCDGPDIGIGPKPIAECWAAAAAKNDPGAPVGWPIQKIIFIDL